MRAADVADKIHIKLEWKYNGEGYTEVFYKMVAQIARRVAKMVQLYQAEALMTKLLYKPAKVEMHAQGSE